MDDVANKYERILKLFMQIVNEARLLKGIEYCNHYCGVQLDAIIEAAEMGIEIINRKVKERIEKERIEKERIEK